MKTYHLFYLLALLCACSCGNNNVGSKALPSLIEIEGAEGISAEALQSLGEEEPVSVYRWGGHWVMYGHFLDLQRMERRIAGAYPAARIKLYERPFYVFDRTGCATPAIEGWSHTVMTANLVADEAAQEQYMEYHARQAELFPEVAQGFCNADFQQVLVFRNGRQLMLVISIPAGKNLDDLNPKTVENNPRVDEWNAIMSLYQEGIEGTAPNETWVTFEPAATSSFPLNASHNHHI